MNAAQRKVLLDRGFLVGAQIGRGTFGTVFQCTELKSHVTYALKAMDLRTLRMRSEFQESRLLREVQVMRKLHHPFIVRLHDVVFAEDALFLIMELIIGVDLFDTIVAKGGFDELGAKFIFYQLCSALEYIHDQGILHRDVKPENILLRGPSPPSNGSGAVEMTGCIPSKTWIKLVDFGLSKLQTSGDVNSFVGTPRYIAPEVITVGEEEKRRRAGVKASVQNGETTSNPSSPGCTSSASSNGTDSSGVEAPQTTMIPSYSTPADCFSAGICLYVMMANCFPKFQDGIILFEGNNGRPQQFSAEAKDLILALTNPDPEKRFSMKQALAHPWLAPARPLVENLVRSETSIVSLSKNPSFNFTTAATSRPNKRPFVVSSPHHGHGHHQGFPSSQFPTVVSAQNWQAMGGATAATSNIPGQAAQVSSIANGSRPSNTDALGLWSGTLTSGTAAASPSSNNIIPAIEREFWFACEASSQICSTPEVRGAMRLTKNMLVLSERVVLKCAQTGMSVIDLIPDMRAALMVDERGTPLVFQADPNVQQGTFEFVKQMLDMVKAWIDQLKQETKETLQNNHQVLISMGQIVQQISLSPDVVAESVASLSFSSHSSQQQQQPQQRATPSLACLSHLERVEQLLRVLESFWGRMDTALNVLQQRATILDGLTAMVTRSPQMADRFLQKLEEYFTLWQSAAIMCQQFQQFNPGNNLTAGSTQQHQQQQPSAQHEQPIMSSVAAPSAVPMMSMPMMSGSHPTGTGMMFNAGTNAGQVANMGATQASSVSGTATTFFPSATGMYPPSTVVVTNETSPSSSLESYDGDI